ncbi:MAG: glycoside hydrolase family 32 protein [Eubacteriales bacterium]|nr:glycoside hydrolase family 32 protein [Eubacteriales bacterium]
MTELTATATTHRTIDETQALPIVPRPILHFTPQKGWINDPNGLVFYQGRYHLFAQYFPDDTRWGPMHWLHAVSDDLQKWQELPIALAPDDDGMVFSGSAWFDRENVSQLGTPEQPPLLLFYTMANQQTQDQRVAWSIDGVNFTRYAHNPVIANPGQRDFRDPKIFHRDNQGDYYLVVAAGDHVDFFKSHTLLDWTKCGTFGPEGNPCPGVWECPDLIQMAASDGTNKWVFIISHIRPITEGGSRTHYLVGDFDGVTFTCTQKEKEPVWLDPGFDNYAAVSFAHHEQPLILGWGNNWNYADKIPKTDFCGQMTYPRKLQLQNTPSGLRLASQLWPDPSVALPFDIEKINLTLPRALTTPLPLGLVPPQTSVSQSIRATTASSLISFDATGAFVLTLSNALGEIFQFGLSPEGQFWFDRVAATRRPFWLAEHAAAFTRIETERLITGPVRGQILIDQTCLEILADDGLFASFVLVFPEAPYQTVTIENIID